MRRLLPLVLLLLLAACGPATISMDVTRFTALLPAEAGRSFAFQPDPPQAGNLEFQQYAGLVSGQLVGHGWQPAASAAGAAALVAVRWSLGPPVTQAWSQPDLTVGAWGWGPGPWGGGFAAPFPYYDVQTWIEWPIWLEVVIFDGPAWRAGSHKVLWQGRAVTSSRTAAVAAVMPYLVSGLFADFPGLNGQTVRVAVPVSGG